MNGPSPTARCAVCRACGREAAVRDLGAAGRWLVVNVQEDPSRAPSAIPPIDCVRCARMLAYDWPRIVGDAYELDGGDPGAVYGAPTRASSGTPYDPEQYTCVDCGRVVSVIPEYNGWPVQVPCARPR